MTNKYIFSYVLYIIGWRGGRIKDEPQHAFQGALQRNLRNIDIEYIVLETFEDLNLEKIDKVLVENLLTLIIKKIFLIQVN